MPRCLQFVFLALLACGATASAQVAPAQVTIPLLANTARPAAIEFEGASCDVDAAGTAMRCAFEQVFLTTSSVVPDTCLVTTNHYERAFTKQANARWVSSEGPQGVCGVVDVTTLQDEGGVRWTMETRKTATRKDASPSCRTVDEPPEVWSWQNIRRTLPCRFIQPGGIGR